MKELIFIFCLIFGQDIYAQKNSKASRSYFSKVAKIIKSNYYFVDSINFKLVESNAKKYLLFSDKLSDSYPAIDSILYHLHENHNYFWSPKIKQGINIRFPLNYPFGKQLRSGVAYIKIPHLVAHNDSIQFWADSLRSIYETYNDSNTQGWIIDLRGNFGGNMHPMLTGLYPLFGDTTILKFKQRNVESQTYQFANGFLIQTLNNKIYKKLLTYKNSTRESDKRKVAVIIDGKVASAGEVLAIALSNRKNTKLFGMPTAGIPTIVRNWELSDGAFLGMVTGVFFSNQNTPYLNSIKPTFVVDNINGDEAVEKAIEWIREK